MKPVVFNFTEVLTADGECLYAMIPQSRYDALARKQYALGESYPLVVLEARSRASHGHFFAALKDGFDNLPEGVAGRWETPEHLRKWLLIQSGWFVEKEVEFGSSAYAKRAAILLHDDFDEHARIFQPNNGTKLIIRRARSQSVASMGKADFEASKKACLDLLESMIHVEPGTLAKNAGSAA